MRSEWNLSDADSTLVPWLCGLTIGGCLGLVVGLFIGAWLSLGVRG